MGIKGTVRMLLLIVSLLWVGSLEQISGTTTNTLTERLETKEGEKRGIYYEFQLDFDCMMP